MARDLTILVMSYRTPKLLRAALSRLKEVAPQALIHVMDAGSGDASRRIAESFAGVRFHERPNHSMANLLNEGLMLADTPFILQLNADVILDYETLPALRDALARPGVGMVGPRCYSQVGRWQPQGFLYRRYHWLLDTFKRPYVAVHWLSGCCTLLRAEALQRVGGMNSSLRFYNEDIEWCYRFRRAGYRCLLVNTATHHVGGASTPASARFIAEGLRGGYQLSRLRYPRAIRALHLAYLWLYAWVTPLVSKNSEAIAAARLIRRMIRQDSWCESPFGDTLADRNPLYE